MKVFREYLLLVLFPLLYILIDITIRNKYLIYYSNIQLLFYIASIAFSFFLYLITIVLMAENAHRKLFKHTAGLILAFYYSFTILSSYVFFFSTGIFPNYYTLRYFKMEPASTFSLFKDSIHLWQILVFSLFLISLYYFFLHLSESGVLKKKHFLIKPRAFFIIIISLLTVLVINIKTCDQCMIVDANFTVDLGRHLSKWSENTSFTGDGLPSRKPLKLTRTERTPQFNVLVIIFESLRQQNMQVYGYSRETTPFLNSLSINEPENFYLFRNAYTASTTTMLAVPAILSGVTPEQPFRYYETFPLLWEYAEMIKYNTFFISSQTMQWYRFDKYYSANKTDFYWNRDNSGLPSYSDGGVDDRITTDRVNDHIASIANKPFFGVIQFNTTHFPYKAPEEYFKWDANYIDNYDNSILFQDDMLRKIFSNLKKHNLLKNTVVIMAGDHGEAFKEHNSIGHIDTYNSETVSIPLMIYIPRGIIPKLNLSQLKYNTKLNVSNADIAPTIINLLGLRKDKVISSIYPHFTGRNLLEAFDKDRNILTLNSSEIMPFNSGVSLVKGDYHYIMRTNLIPYSREFYNIKTDPLEVNNLINNTGSELLDPLHNVLKENSHTKKIYNQYYP